MRTIDITDITLSGTDSQGAAAADTEQLRPARSEGAAA